jgi:hypothetical protein
MVFLPNANVVVLLHPHHLHLPLDNCSLFDLDHLVKHLFYDYLDQNLVRVEWYHLGRFLEVNYLDLVALHRQSSFFVEHHMGLPHHLQDQDQLAFLRAISLIKHRITHDFNTTGGDIKNTVCTRV